MHGCELTPEYELHVLLPLVVVANLVKAYIMACC